MSEMSVYDVDIARIGEEELIVVIDDGLVFDTDQYTVLDDAKDRVEEVISILSKYPYFHFDVGFYAQDAIYSEPNKELFLLRLDSLNKYFSSINVQNERLSFYLNKLEHNVCDSEFIIESCQKPKVEVYITPL
ncbi:hypothetical protein ACPV4B_08400 [Vibrio parahaemolyticus]|uniref:hypothetical protein n=1 Tax=Vibrio mediterranei TaxID=689 RepID=UPI00406817A6